MLPKVLISIYWRTKDNVCPPALLLWMASSQPCSPRWIYDAPPKSWTISEEPTTRNPARACCGKLQENYWGQSYYGRVMGENLPPGFQRKPGTRSSMRIDIIIMFDWIGPWLQRVAWLTWHHYCRTSRVCSLWEWGRTYWRSDIPSDGPPQ